MRKGLKFMLAASFATLIFTGCDNGLSHDVQQKVLNADNAINSYEWFIQQESDIKAKYKQEERAYKDLDDFMATLPSDREKWVRQDKDEAQRLRTIASGIGYQVDGMVEDYNAKSRMEHKALFAKKLPTNIFRGVKQRLEFKYGI
ncbi:MAG: hypothetical protein ACRC0G_07465 [Fusobacteriaceae bacterium]